MLRDEWFASLAKRVVDALPEGVRAAVRAAGDSRPAVVVQGGGDLVPAILVAEIARRYAAAEHPDDIADWLASFRSPCARSFRRGDAATDLASAAVQMTLGSDGGPATAWSLAPMSAATPNESTSSFSLGPDAKILGADLRLATIGRTQTRCGEDVFLQARGLLTSEPGWEFSRTLTTALAGSYRLVLVVRAPARHQARLMVTLSASIKTGPWPRRFRKTLSLPAAADSAAIIF